MDIAKHVYHIKYVKNKFNILELAGPGLSLLKPNIGTNYKLRNKKKYIIQYNESISIMYTVNDYIYITLRSQFSQT